jgi:hypothetical protein
LTLASKIRAQAGASVAASAGVTRAVFFVFHQSKLLATVDGYSAAPAKFG